MCFTKRSINDRCFRDSESAALRTSLVSNLRRDGVIRSPGISRAFVETPREHFIESVYQRGSGATACISAPDEGAPDEERQAWLRLVYSNEVLLTELDKKGLPLVSSTMPSLMALMLEAAELGGGGNALEIGTGTGYNAAVMASAMGAGGAVVSIEVEPTTATSAARALALTPVASQVTVNVADGRAGYASMESFDAIVVTASSPVVPRKLLRQLRGRLVIDIRGGITGALLVVSREGNRAHGRFIDIPGMGFIRIRSVPGGQGGPTAVSWPLLTGEDELPVDLSVADDLQETGFGFLYQLLHQDAQILGLGPTAESRVRRVLVVPNAGAILFERLHKTNRWVARYSSSALWSELRSLWEVWVGLGRPSAAAFHADVVVDEESGWVSVPGGSHWKVAI